MQWNLRGWGSVVIYIGGKVVHPNLCCWASVGMSKWANIPIHSVRPVALGNKGPKMSFQSLSSTPEWYTQTAIPFTPDGDMKGAGIAVWLEGLDTSRNERTLLPTITQLRWSIRSWIGYGGLEWVFLSGWGPILNQKAPTKWAQTYDEIHFSRLIAHKSR